jgi:hypothetical protein
MSLFEYKESDLRGLKVNIWRQKANNKEQWASKDENILPKFLNMN